MINPRFVACLLLGIATAAVAKPIRFRLPSDPITLDWNLAHTSNETQILMNIMTGLLESGDDMKVKPALAEKWEISSDELTYKFFLRKDAKWSDGKPVTAQQFVDSWMRLLDPKNKSPYANFLFDIDGAEKFAKGKKSKVAIEALDASTLQVKLWRRNASFIHIPTFWVTFPVRKENFPILKKQPVDVAKLVVTGPYRPIRWDAGKLFILEPNANYTLPRSHGKKIEDRVEITFENDETKAREAHRRGDADFLLQASTADMVKLPTGARLIQVPYLSTTYFGMNATLSPTRQAEIRKAIALVIQNEKSKFPALLQGGQVVTDSFAPASILESRAIAPNANAVFEARQILTKAGFANGQGLPRLKLCSEIYDRGSLVVNAIAQALDQHLGIKTDVITHASGSQFIAALKSKDCHLFISHWGGDFPDPLNFYEVFRGDAITNYAHWKNKEYDTLLDMAKSTSDAKIRLQIYSQIDAFLLEKESVIVPLFNPKNALIVGGAIKQMTLTPLNYLYLKDTVTNDDAPMKQ